MKQPKMILTAAALALLSLPAPAADPKPQPSTPMTCMAGKEMQCDMARGMGDMRDRMAHMQEAMNRCAQGEAHCDKDNMMKNMKDMQAHMDQMMKNMMAMPGASDASPAPGAKGDHSQHNHDKK